MINYFINKFNYTTSEFLNYRNLVKRIQYLKPKVIKRVVWALTNALNSPHIYASIVQKIVMIVIMMIILVHHQTL